MIPGIQGMHGLTGAATVAGSTTPSQGALAWYGSSTAGSAYALDQESYDTGSYHSLVTNTDRMTIPSGVSLVRLIGQETRGGAGTPDPQITKAGASFLGSARAVTQDDGTGLATGPVAVSAADYFSLNKGTGVTPNTAGGIWFAAEVLDPATKYAVVSKTANQALTGGVSTALSWDNEVADTDGFHDNVTNNTRLTVPSGVTRVRLSANLASTSNVSTTYQIQILKNGSTAVGLPVTSSRFTGRVNLVSAVLDVTPGDYFEVVVISTLAQTVATGDTTWFSIEDVPVIDRSLVKKSATQSVTSGVAVAIAFGAEEYDAPAAHDNSTNNSRLTVPAGFTKARLCYSIITANASGTPKSQVRMNGSASFIPGLPSWTGAVTGEDYMSGFGAWIDVTPGDYFEVFFTPGANQTLPNDVRTWFSMELKP